VHADGAPAGAAAPHTTITADLASVLWRRRWAALAAFVAVLLGVGIVTASLPKVYETTAYMLVNPDQPGNNDFEQTQVSQALVTTYAQLLESQNLADEVSRRLGGTYTDNPKDAISVEAVPESQLLKITGEANSPEVAQKLTNTYSQVFQERIRELSNAKAAGGRASVAEPATLPEAAVRPKPKLYLAIGAVLAALAATALSFAQRQLSTPARTLRRRVAQVDGAIVQHDGTRQPLTRADLLTPLERTLRALSVAVPMIAGAVLLTHVT
jgi:capsular polysaccharide biosynthesis protein